MVDLVFKLFVRALAKFCSALATAFGVGLFMLTVGVVLDLDHVLVLAIKGLPITWENLATQAARPLHIPAMAFTVFFTCIYLARVDRLWTYQITPKE